MDRKEKLVQPVTPGDKLGVIEEYAPGNGTYVNNGVIYAKQVGYAMVNKESKKIEVMPKTRIPFFPAKGQKVLGKVQHVEDKFAMVKVFKVNGFELKSPFTAVIHVSFISRFFTKTVYDAFKPGDLIYAQIIGDKNQPFQLTTAAKDLGVLEAYCSNCGELMILDKKQLKCPKCGSVEKRKISEFYGRKV
mgnify:CR=1 FL=1